MVQIPDSIFGWSIGVAAGMVSWLIRLEARLNARITRSEHEAIAARVASETHSQFAEIKVMLQSQNDSASLNRQLVADSLAEIRTKVAVLRARAGNNQYDENGSHNRKCP